LLAVALNVADSSTTWACSGVAVAGLEDDHVVAVDEVDEAVFFTDPAGPGSGEGVAEWFGFAFSLEGSRKTSSIGRLIRLRVALSAFCQ
jgi:hypothetical protein